MTYEIFYIYDVKKRKPMVFPTLSFLASLVVNFVMHASLSFFWFGVFLFFACFATFYRLLVFGGRLLFGLNDFRTVAGGAGGAARKTVLPAFFLLTYSTV